MFLTIHIDVKFMNRFNFLWVDTCEKENQVSDVNGVCDSSINSILEIIPQAEGDDSFCNCQRKCEQTKECVYFIHGDYNNKHYACELYQFRNSSDTENFIATVVDFAKVEEYNYHCYYMNEKGNLIHMILRLEKFFSIFEFFRKWVAAQTIFLKRYFKVLRVFQKRW